LTTDKGAVDREVKVVDQQQTALKGKLKVIEDDVRYKLDQNLTIAKEVVRLQLEAARRIDQRTRDFAKEK
jgi:hypothetical protein